MIKVRLAVILMEADRILLAKHSKRGKDYWVLPGGHVKGGETLQNALTRETMEELSLEVEVGPLLFVSCPHGPRLCLPLGNSRLGTPGSPAARG